MREVGGSADSNKKTGRDEHWTKDQSSFSGLRREGKEEDPMGGFFCLTIGLGSPWLGRG